MDSVPGTQKRLGIGIPIEGQAWLSLTVLFWGVGILKGVHLLTLLGWLLLSVWGVNFFIARRRLKAIRARRHPPDHPFAGDPFGLEIELENPTRSPTLGVRVEDRGPAHRVRWFVPRLGAGERLGLRRSVTLPRRGWYDMKAVRLSCRFPLGLVEARTLDGDPARVLVYPRLRRIHRGRLRQFLMAESAVGGGAAAGSAAIAHRTAQIEFHGVREFRTGDSPRWIHWRTTARRGVPMVREFEEAPTENLVLIVDPWAPEGSEPAPAAPFEPLEDTLSLAAGICWEWCRQTGDRLIIGLAGNPPRVDAGVTGRGLTRAVLEALAAEPGTAAPDVAGLLALLARADIPRAPVLLVSPRPDSFQESLANWFGHPVAVVETSGTTRYDFYETGGRHAAGNAIPS